MEIDIYQRGQWPKYRVTITDPDFNQKVDDYWFRLAYGMMGGETVVQKDELITDEDGTAYLAFDTTDMIGKVTVECHYFVPDSDFADGYREEVDMQMLCFVADTPCVQLMCCGCDAREHRVEYKPVYGSDFSTAYLVLRTSEQEVLRDGEGNAFRIRKEQN